MKILLARHELALIFIFLSLVQIPAALADKPIEGFDYQLIEATTPGMDSTTVEVVEMFWYGCPHCYRFEPRLKEWLARKPSYVLFKRIPAIPRSEWTPLARAHYTAKILGVVDRIHQPLFDAIHKGNQKLHDKASIQAFFAKHGVSKREFEQAWDSNAVGEMVQQAREQTRRYELSGVPTMIVNGKYRSSLVLAGGSKNLLKVVDHLVSKEHQQADQ